MKKIVGVMTFHRAYNYGAVLQTYALYNYVNKHICKAEIIDYFPNNYTPPKGRFVRKIVKIIKGLLLGKDECKRQDKLRKFDEFMKRYTVSDSVYYGDVEIEKNPPHYDVLISGSDQILNTSLTGNSRAYYLSFGNTERRISYGSSFGGYDVTDVEKQLIRTYLKKYNALSVREESGAEIIYREIQEKATVVVDPVFLLSKEEWIRMTYETNVGKYILVYAMENTVALSMAVEAAQTYYQLPTKIILGGDFTPSYNGEILKDCGPIDYLSYINNATCIVTNSFHGSAFSIIFDIPFICVGHSKRNARIENLMKLIDVQARMIKVSDCDIDIEKSIIHHECRDKLDSLIQRSKEYLLQNLEG